MEERRRISRELHDRALQMLSSVRLRAEICRLDLMGRPRELEKELSTIEETTEKAISEIRSLLADNQSRFDLEPGSLERRLREELDIFSGRTGFKLEFKCSITARNLPYQIERELYFILREGILNAVRHARATEIHLELVESPAGLDATLADNGVGFDMALAGESNHYGLRSMRERIERIGGNLRIETGPGHGTQIIIRVPLRHKKNSGRPGTVV
jgi:NarL family two-component system sensor histidine kinase LiaS